MTFDRLLMLTRNAALTVTVDGQERRVPLPAGTAIASDQDTTRALLATGAASIVGDV